MSVEIAVARGDSTPEYKDGQGSIAVVLSPTVTPVVFQVGHEPFWLRAFGLSGADEIRVLQVAGPDNALLTAPFRPVAPEPGDPAIDVTLTASRNNLPLMHPGRYKLERTSGAASATVFGFPASVSHEFGNYYAQITGDSVVNSITEGTISDGLAVVIDPEVGDVVFNAEIVVSPTAGNTLTEAANGLLVPALTAANIVDTATVDMAMNVAVPAVPVISANVKISANAGNQISAQADGIFSAPIGSSNVADTTSIDLTLNAAVPATPVLSAALIVSPDAGNRLSVLANGAYATPGVTLDDEVIVGQSNTFTTTDADVDVPVFTGMTLGTMPLTTFPSSALIWTPSNSPTLGEIELQIGIVSSSTAGPTDSYLQVQMKDDQGDVVCTWRIPNPGANTVSGAYTLKYIGAFFGMDSPGWTFEFTTISDASFVSITVLAVKIVARQPL